MIKRDKKSLAVLLDPDKLDKKLLSERIDAINNYSVDYIFVGGSLISSDNMAWILAELKEKTSIPKIIFPGNGLHVNSEADAILLLSLISGRNADLLIGQHVISAPALKRSGLTILPTGYLLIDGGKQTTVSYISNTVPIPRDKPDIAAATAMAGEMLGLKITYLDAGSGALFPISEDMIRSVREVVSTPIIVGGGIKSVEEVKKSFMAGADVVVIGNAIEQNPDFLKEASKVADSLSFSFA